MRLTVEQGTEQKVAILKSFVRLWCDKYDLSIEENRSALGQWIEVFRVADPAFAHELQAILDAYSGRLA